MWFADSILLKTMFIPTMFSCVRSIHVTCFWAMNFHETKGSPVFRPGILCAGSYYGNKAYRQKACRQLYHVYCKTLVCHTLHVHRVYSLSQIVPSTRHTVKRYMLCRSMSYCMPLFWGPLWLPKSRSRHLIWAVTFIPMHMPKTVCITNYHNKIVQLEVGIMFVRAGVLVWISQLMIVKPCWRGTSPKR